MDFSLKLLTKSEVKKHKINNKYIIDNDINNFDKYLKIQSFYRKILEDYILENIDIANYDEKISNSNLEFGLIDNKMMNLYHRTSYMNLKYIYLRNYLFIEKMSKDDIDYLYNKILKKDYIIGDKELDIIKRTYKNVINDNYKHGEYKKNTTTCYGNVTPDNILPSDSLVFCIHYGKNNKKLDKVGFLENYKQKNEFLNNLKNEMEDKISKKLDVDVKILIRDYVGE